MQSLMLLNGHNKILWGGDHHMLETSMCKYHNIALILIYLLTAIGLTPGGSSTVHISHLHTKQYIEQHH